MNPIYQPGQWQPANIPTQQDITSMGQTINNIVNREMGNFAKPPYYNGTLRPGSMMGNIWYGQFGGR